MEYVRRTALWYRGYPLRVHSETPAQTRCCKSNQKRCSGQSQLAMTKRNKRFGGQDIASNMERTRSLSSSLRPQQCNEREIRNRPLNQDHSGKLNTLLWKSRTQLCSLRCGDCSRSVTAQEISAPFQEATINFLVQKYLLHVTLLWTNWTHSTTSQFTAVIYILILIRW
jgi:hypothetical protein